MHTSHTDTHGYVVDLSELFEQVSQRLFSIVAQPLGDNTGITEVALTIALSRYYGMETGDIEDMVHELILESSDDDRMYHGAHKVITLYSQVLYRYLLPHIVQRLPNRAILGFSVTSAEFTGPICPRAHTYTSANLAMRYGIVTYVN